MWSRTLQGTPGSLGAMDRPVFTLSAAAEVCGVSRDTVRRRLRAGAFPNAHQDPSQQGSPWVVPIEDLLAAGFRPGGTPEPAQAAAPVDELEVERRRRRELELELAGERGKVAALERAVSMAELALRALPPAPPPEPPRRQRWWRRS